MGALGLGTSSKLLEPSAKGMWGGGMVESSPVVTAFLEGGGGWAEARET
jgi:hypothetical protein